MYDFYSGNTHDAACVLEGDVTVLFFSSFSSSFASSFSFISLITTTTITLTCRPIPGVNTEADELRCCEVIGVSHIT